MWTVTAFYSHYDYHPSMPEGLKRYYGTGHLHLILQLLSAKAISGHTPPPQRPTLTLTARIARYTIPWF